MPRFPLASRISFVSVSADVSAAQAGLSSLDKQLNDTATSFERAAPAALLLAGAGAAVGAGLASSVGAAATFEKQMSGVRAVMNPADIKQFGAALDQLALQLGADTSFSAQQAAAGIEELIKAGIPAQAVLEGAGKAALSLAAATGTDVATAATIAAQAMNAFKIPVSQLPTIVDRLAGVTNVSAADMSDLRFGLQAAGSVAATVGLSFEDTAAAIGIFANNGLRGQDAGTSLKTMLINLVPNTKQQTEAFKRLGLITADGSNAFFDAQGHVKSLAQVSGILQNALKGMTDQQKIATLQVLFGTDAMRAAAILAKTGADGVNEFVDQVKQVSAADQAAERLNNFLGRMEQLGGSLQTVQITIGRFFLPALGAIADTVKNVLNAFSGMSGQAQGFVTALVSIGGAIASSLGGLVLLTPILRTLGPSFAALGSVLVRIAPMFLSLSGVAAVLFAAWQANLFGIRELVQRAFDAVPETLDRVGGFFAQAGPLWENNILPAIQTIGNEIERHLIPVFNDILPVVLDVADHVGPILGNLGLVIDKALSGNLSGAFDTFRAVLTALIPQLGPVFALLENLGAVVFPALQSAINAASGLWETQLNPAIQHFGEFLANEVGPQVATFANNILPTLQTAADAVRAFWDGQLFPTLQAMGTILSQQVAPLIADFVGQQLPTLISGAQSVKVFWDEQLLPTLGNPGPVLDEFGAAIARFSAQAQTLGQAGALGPFAQTLSEFFNSLGEIEQQVGSLGPLASAIGNFADSLNNLNNAVFNLQARLVDSTLGNLATAFTNFANTVEPARPALEGISNTVGTLGQALQGVTDFFNNAATAINSLATAINNLAAAPTLNLPQLPFGLGAQPTPQNGAQVRPAAFNPNGAGGGGSAPVINFNAPVSINGAGDLADFVQQIAVAIDASTRRVNVPPDNSGFPPLATSFA